MVVEISVITLNNPELNAIMCCTQGVLLLYYCAKGFVHTHNRHIPPKQWGERFGYMNYGYLWYKPYDDKEVYAAVGDSGNIIYVNKELNVSVGMTGTFKPRIFDRVDFIEREVLSVIGG